MASFRNVVVGLGIVALGFAAACTPGPTYIQGPDECKGDDCEETSSSNGSSGKNGSKQGGGSSSSSSSGSSGSSGTHTPGDDPPDDTPPNPGAYKDSFAYTELQGGLAELTIKFTDYANGCAVDEKGDSKKNSTYLKVAAKKTGVQKIEAGTYEIGGTGTYAEASENKLDGACGKTKIGATAGKVIIESVANDRAKGSYEITLPSGVVKGTFDSALCNVPDGVEGACLD